MICTLAPSGVGHIAAELLCEEDGGGGGGGESMLEDTTSETVVMTYIPYSSYPVLLGDS